VRHPREFVSAQRILIDLARPPGSLPKLQPARESECKAFSSADEFFRKAPADGGHPTMTGCARLRLRLNQLRPHSTVTSSAGNDSHRCHPPKPSRPSVIAGTLRFSITVWLGNIITLQPCPRCTSERSKLPMRKWRVETSAADFFTSSLIAETSSARAKCKGSCGQKFHSVPFPVREHGGPGEMRHGAMPCPQQQRHGHQSIISGHMCHAARRSAATCYLSNPIMFRSRRPAHRKGTDQQKRSILRPTYGRFLVRPHRRSSPRWRAGNPENKKRLLNPVRFPPDETWEIAEGHFVQRKGRPLSGNGRVPQPRYAVGHKE